MPQVEFARADLPWLFTPAAPASGRTRLRPWLVLVVVRRQRRRAARSLPSGPLPVLEIDGPARAAELPDLAQSWAWAHAQISGLPARQHAGRRPRAPTRPRLLAAGLPAPAASRAPRYLACLVPAFAVGVQAGPRRAGDRRRASLAPAWTRRRAGPLRLPVYHSWEFATGPAGSFETLVRRLQPASARRRHGAAADARHQRRPAAGCRRRGRARHRHAERAARARAGRRRRRGRTQTRVPFQAALERLLTAAPARTRSRRRSTARRRRAQRALPAGRRAAGVAARAQPGSAAARRRRGRHARRAGAPGAADGARLGRRPGRSRDANALLRRAQLARELGGVAHGAPPRRR